MVPSVSAVFISQAEGAPKGRGFLVHRKADKKRVEKRRIFVKSKIVKACQYVIMELPVPVTVRLKLCSVAKFAVW